MSFFQNIGQKAFEFSRIIHPIGQGAFYSETIKDENSSMSFVFVYDCGSFSKKRLFEEIDVFNDTHPQIDVLFISHFHFDHTNGVQRLREVNKIFIPKVSPTCFLVDIIYNSLEPDAVSGDSISFMMKCLPVLSDQESGDPHIISVGYNTDFEYPVLFLKNHTVWQYGVLNPEPDSALEKILLSSFCEEIPELSAVLGDYSSWKTKDDYYRIINAVRQKALLSRIKRVYKRIYGSHNDYSMMLKSHKAENTGVINGDKNSCIYTGDGIITPSVKSLIDMAGTDYIQVPHHGSKNNSDVTMYHKNMSAFISCGDKNMYNHPDKSLLNHIIRECDETMIVTDNKETILKRTFKLLA